MWQAFREDVAEHGVEIVTVALETTGAEACRQFIEAANPAHPSLIDQYHKSAELFGFVNIPNAVWIDEDGMIVRPSEPAPAPPSMKADRPNIFADVVPPQRLLDIMGEAVKIRSNPAAYEEALRDWITNGSQSQFAMTPDEVVDRSQPRSADEARGQANFELAAHFEANGDHGAAIPYYREAHRLTPENFSYRRQAWSLEPNEMDGPAARFWQGPAVGAEDDWPYEGDWLSDVKAMGAENYYPEFKAEQA